MTLWIWRHFRLEVPADWEMLGFSRNLRQGRCAFADRYQYRLEFNWRVVEGAPDFERMMSDYASKLAADGQVLEPRRVTEGVWHGIEGKAGTGTTSRWGRFSEASKCLIEIVMMWPGQRDQHQERDILRSVAEEPARRDGRHRWRAFGMDLLAGGDNEFRDCRVEPARAQLTFAPGKSRGREEKFQRLGLVDEWLHGPVGEWLAATAPEDLTKAASGTARCAGHEVRSLAGALPGVGPGRLFRRRRWFVAAAWICPLDGRLYHASCTDAPAQDVTLAGERLSCCAEMKLAA